MSMGLVLVLGGILVLLTGIGVRRGWFVHSQKIRLVTEILGETGATLFYIAIGLISVIAGILMIMSP